MSKKNLITKDKKTINSCSSDKHEQKSSHKDHIGMQLDAHLQRDLSLVRPKKHTQQSPKNEESADNAIQDLSPEQLSKKSYEDHVRQAIPTHAKAN